VPELQCEEIQYQIEVPNGGAYRLKTKAISVKLAAKVQPDAALFRSPANYREVPPSEGEKAVMLALGGDPTKCKSCGRDWPLLDRYYERHQ